MAKLNVRKVKFTPEEMAYELPDELDFSKLKYVGRGIETVDKLIARRNGIRRIVLDPDVAREFKSDEEVNEALRLVQKMRDLGKPGKRRRTA